MAWELRVPEPLPAGCCELGALLAAVGRIYNSAEAALIRREGELLSSMAIDEAQPNAPWQTLRVVTRGGKVIEVPLLALINPRRHQVAELALEWTVAAVEVATADGPRVGLRRAEAEEEGALSIKIVCGGRQRRLTLLLGGLELVDQAIEAGVGRRASRTIPQAEVFLLDAAAAARVREELRLSPRRAPARPPAPAKGRGAGGSVGGVVDHLVEVTGGELVSEPRVGATGGEAAVQEPRAGDPAGEVAVAEPPVGATDGEVAVAEPPVGAIDGEVAVEEPWGGDPGGDDGAVVVNEMVEETGHEVSPAEAPVTEAPGGAAAEQEAPGGPAALEEADEPGVDQLVAPPSEPPPEWRGPPRRRRWAKKRRRPER